MELAFLVVRQWRSRPGRFLLSLLSVAVAAAAVLATVASRRSVRAGFAERAGIRGAALDIVATEGGRFDESEVFKFERIDGVRRQIPMLSRAGMARVKGRRIRSVIVGVPTRGGDQPGVLDATAGNELEGATDVLIAAELAEAYGVTPGDRLTLLTRQGPRRLTVVGLTRAEALDELSPGAQLAMPLRSLQELMELPGKIDRVRVDLLPNASTEAVRAAIARQLPSDFSIQAPLGRLVIAESIVNSIELAMQFACALAVVMAVFIVFNSLRMNFGERRKELATLRLLGASQGQLARLYLFEGALLGLLGAALGAPAGLFIARSLSSAMDMLTGAATTLPTLPASAILAACFAGVLAAAAAAAAPAYFSRSIAPREAFEGVSSDVPQGVPWAATALAAALWVASIGLMGLVATERVAAQLAIPAGLGVLLGFVALLPALIGPTVTTASVVIRPLLGFRAELAAGQLLKRPDRAGLTVGVMVVAISNGLGLGNAVLTNIADVQQWHRRAMQGDAILFNPNATAFPGANDEISGRLAEIPDVSNVVRIHFLSGRANGYPVMCIARDFPANRKLPWNIGAAETQRVRRALTRGEAVVTTALARKLQLVLGGDVRLELRGRTTTVGVAALVNDYMVGGMAVYLDCATASETLSLGTPDAFIANAKPGSSNDAFLRAVEPIARDYSLTVRSFADMQADVDRVIQSVVGALWGLMATGFIVGALAIANTLNISILEQTRELGLLRVVGLTRLQQAELLFAESILLAAAAVVFGTAAGITTAWVIHLCSQPVLGYSTPFGLRWWLVGVNVVGCFVVGVLAATPSVLRAARLNPLDAIAIE